jgi:hypothetical protein
MHVAFVGVAFACCVFDSSVPASARIRLNESEIRAGVLVVAGKTRHRHQTITLDDKFVARSDRHRRFAFHVRYDPPRCRLRLQAGRDMRDATVAHCTAASFAGATGPPPAKSDAGASGPTLITHRARH